MLIDHAARVEFVAADSWQLKIEAQNSHHAGIATTERAVAQSQATQQTLAAVQPMAAHHAM
jgi:hypothetical protein